MKPIIRRPIHVFCCPTLNNDQLNGKCWLLSSAVTVWCTVKGMESAGDNLWVQTESPLSAPWQGQRDGDGCMSEDLRVTTEGCGAADQGVPFPFCQRFQLSPSTLVTIYEHDLPTCAAPVLSPEPNLSHPPDYIKPLPHISPPSRWPSDLEPPPRPHAKLYM